MWLWFLSLSFSTALAAQKVSYPAQDVVLKNVKEVRIVGVRGSIKLSHNPAKRFKDKLRLAVKHTRDRKSDDWYLSVERRGHTLFLEVFSTAYGKEWRKQVRQEKWPEFDLTLEGASRPTTVSWLEGRLEFNGWPDPLDVSFLKGSAEFTKGKGAVKLQAVQADVNVREQSAPLEIRGEAGRVSLKGVRADVKVNWLAGELEFEKCQGSFTVEAGDAKLRMASVGGEWSVHLPKGSAEIVEFSGRLKAKGAQSTWNVKPVAGADVSVITESGPVQIVRSPGRTKVFLTSMSGEIKAPPELKSRQEEGVRVVEGTDASVKEAALGLLFVKTRSGAIRFW